MRNNVLTLFILMIAVLFTACDDNNSKDTFTGEFETASDIQAGTNGFTFYNLSSGEMVADSNSTNWDIGFKDAGFEIFIITNGGVRGPGNGGAVLLDVAFDEILEVPANDQFNVEADGEYAVNPAPGGWWIYTGENPAYEANHAVLPKTPHTILVRTANGGYAKIEVVSYYEGNPDTSSPEFVDLRTRPESGYFTFKYEVIN